MSINQYDESIHYEVKTLMFIHINIQELKNEVPYAHWLKYINADVGAHNMENYYKSNPLIVYICKKEIEYIINLYEFPLTVEDVLKYVDVNDSTYSNCKFTIREFISGNLDIKSKIIWKIGLRERILFYLTTIGNHNLNESIKNVGKKLIGISYTGYVRDEYTQGMFDSMSFIESIYQCICVIRAIKDMKAPIKHPGYLKVILEEFNIDECCYIPRSSTYIACVHEGIMNIEDEGDGKFLGDIKINHTHIYSSLTKKFRETCLERYQDNSDDKYIWNNICNIIDIVGKSDIDDILYNSYQFYPVFSDNPTDHYIYISSFIKKKYRKKIFEALNSISEKKIITQKYLNKIHTFKNVHHELLFSPELPKWFHNEYTTAMDNFNNIKISSNP